MPADRRCVLVQTELSGRTERSPVRRLDTSQTHRETLLCFGIVRRGIAAGFARAVDGRIVAGWLAARHAHGQLVGVRRATADVPVRVVRALVLEALVVDQDLVVKREKNCMTTALFLPERGTREDRGSCERFQHQKGRFGHVYSSAVSVALSLRVVRARKCSSVYEGGTDECR